MKTFSRYLARAAAWAKRLLFAAERAAFVEFSNDQFWGRIRFDTRHIQCNDQADPIIPEVAASQIIGNFIWKLVTVAQLFAPCLDFSKQF
jgi:hypothetical protein